MKGGAIYPSSLVFPFHFISSDESHPHTKSVKWQRIIILHVWPSGRCYRLLVWLYNPTVDLSLLLFWPSAHIKSMQRALQKADWIFSCAAEKMIECRVRVGSVHFLNTTGWLPPFLSRPMFDVDKIVMEEKITQKTIRQASRSFRFRPSL
jgi:hypothetical protein